MNYNPKKTASKGGNELLVMVVSSIIAAKVVPFAQTIGVGIDSNVLSLAIVTGLATLSRIVGNWMKHRKDGK